MNSLNGIMIVEGKRSSKILNFGKNTIKNLSATFYNLRKSWMTIDLP